jgi:hypothetical protein
MDLPDLGFDPWFPALAGNLRPEGYGIARIAAVDRGSYRIRNERGEIPAELAGPC